mgnify:CR=1 FL=1
MEYVNDIDYLSEFSYSEILVISISAILFFSVLKFFILVYFNYYKNFFFAKVQTSSSSYLLEKYLNNSYFFYLKKNVSELIANIKAEAERFRGFLSVLIDLMFELFVISSILIFLLYVNFIASVHYAKMYELFCCGDSTRLIRLADWLVTLPLLAVEFYLWNGRPFNQSLTAAVGYYSRPCNANVPVFHVSLSAPRGVVARGVFRS